MRIVSRQEIDKPFRGELGEEIYELIGRPDNIGATTKHSVAHVVLQPSKRSPAHRHHESEETYYILSGRGVMQVNSSRFDVHPGVAVLINPGEVHQIWNDDTVKDLEFLAISGP